MADKYRYYLLDLGKIPFDRAVEAKREEGKDSFHDGLAFAYYDVITILLSQADAFEIDPEMLGLKGGDPDRDILGIAPQR